MIQFFIQFSFKVSDSSFILVIATLEDYQSTKLSITGLGGIESYHRLDLFNNSILHEGHLCTNGEEVAVKSKKNDVVNQPNFEEILPKFYKVL